MLPALIDGSRLRSHVRDKLRASLDSLSCTNQQVAMEGGSSVHSRSVSEMGSGIGYRVSGASIRGAASRDESVSFVRSDSALLLQTDRKRHQMQTKTLKLKADASGRFDRPLQAAPRSRLLPSGHLSQPAALVADPVSSKQAGAWPLAMPANSSPKQLALKAHPLEWFPEEEQQEQLATTHAIPAETAAARYRVPLCFSSIACFQNVARSVLCLLSRLLFIAASCKWQRNVGQQLQLPQKQRR